MLLNAYPTIYILASEDVFFFFLRSFGKNMMTNEFIPEPFRNEIIISK